LIIFYLAHHVPRGTCGYFLSKFYSKLITKEIQHYKNDKLGSARKITHEKNIAIGGFKYSDLIKDG